MSLAAEWHAWCVTLGRLDALPLTMTIAPQIIIAIEDRERLRRLVSASDSEIAEQLDTEIERARAVPLCEVPSDVVTMESDLEYLDTRSGQRRRVRLVWPPDANAEEGRVSVLAPLGCALLGLSVGQEIDWRMPGGNRLLRVVAVTR